MVGLTVAKRHDLIAAAEALGLLRRRRPARRTRPRRSHGSSSTPARSSTGGSPTSRSPGFLFGVLEVPAVRARRGPAPGRQLGQAAAHPRAGAASRSSPGCGSPGDAGPGDRRGRPGHRRGRLQAGRARQEAQPRGAHERPEPQPDRRPAGRPRPQRQLACERGEAGRSCPGEDLRVQVIQPGKDAGQGVGYLDDGTMVVVEGGARRSTPRST